MAAYYRDGVDIGNGARCPESGQVNATSKLQRLEFAQLGVPVSEERVVSSVKA
jgi:hypothetical protein